MRFSKMTDFGIALRTERRRANKTLSDIAADAGISIAYMSQIENGTRNPPNAQLMAKIISSLECGKDKEEWFLRYCQDITRDRSILDAVSRLSPATRRLLIERPDAVEACVEAIRAQQIQDITDDASEDWYPDKHFQEVCDKALAATEAAYKAIAALPEEG